jgi:hypothetical protein
MTTDVSICESWSGTSAQQQKAVAMGPGFRRDDTRGEIFARFKPFRFAAVDPR